MLLYIKAFISPCLSHNLPGRSWWSGLVTLCSIRRLQSPITIRFIESINAFTEKASFLRRMKIQTVQSVNGDKKLWRSLTRPWRLWGRAPSRWPCSRWGHSLSLQIFAHFSSQDMPYHVRPDAVFPNNWISVHHSGEVILYPMATPNRWEAASDWLVRMMYDGLWLVRRLERRQDLIQWLKDNFEDHKVIDLMRYEDEGKYLEGTGSIVFDYQGEAGKYITAA